jgi:hypothetical protein
MYISHQALRVMARDGMTPAEQRAADAQLGRIVAKMYQSRRRFGEGIRALARALAPADAGRQAFEK